MIKRVICKYFYHLKQKQFLNPLNIQINGRTVKVSSFNYNFIKLKMVTRWIQHSWLHYLTSSLCVCLSVSLSLILVLQKLFYLEDRCNIDIFRFFWMVFWEESVFLRKRPPIILTYTQIQCWFDFFFLLHVWYKYSL